MTVNGWPLIRRRLSAQYRGLRRLRSRSISASGGTSASETLKDLQLLLGGLGQVEAVLHLDRRAVLPGHLAAVHPLPDLLGGLLLHLSQLGQQPGVHRELLDDPDRGARAELLERARQEARLVAGDRH